MLPAETLGPRPPGRVAIIGDLAGHLDELTGELVRLGADPQTLRLPEDLTVIQVGDLVHRGPDSEGVVALVDRYLRTQSGQWVQLAGNHEGQYLRDPAFEWPHRIEDVAAETLRRWWSNGQMRAAAAVRCGGEDFVVTHAGLTEGYWRRALDAPAAATLAAKAINSFIGTHEDVLFAAGQMLGRSEPTASAGPLWAAAATELVPSWQAAGAMPFSQVHGHSSVVDWRRRWVRGDAELAGLVTLDPDAAHTTVTLSDARIVGVDPGHGAKPHRPWRAFVLELATVLA